MQEASVSHPRVHSVWPVLLDLLLPESVQSAQLEFKKSPKKSKKKTIGPSCQKDLNTMKAHLSTFWSTIVDGALLPSSHERKHLAMELVLLFLPRLPDPTFVDIVLSNTFVRCILTILSDKDTLLHKSALRCLGEIRTWAEKDDVHRVAAIMALQKSSYCKFDVLSKTSTVKILTSGLKSEANVVAFVLTLEDLFQSGESHMVTSARSGSEALVEGKKEGDTSILMNDPQKGQGYEEQDLEGSFASVGKAGDRERVWILEQICALSEQTQLEPTAARVTLFKEVLSFLVLHAIFDAKHKEAATGKGMALKWPRLPLSERIRSLCVARLRSVLVTAQNWALAQRLNDNQLVSGGKSKEQRPQDQHVSDPANFALFVTQFCESIQRLPAVYLARPLTKDDADAVERLRGTVSQLSSAVKGVEGDDQAEKLLAMRSLLLQLLLESFLEPGSVSGSAVDLAICCRKAFPGISAEVTDNLQQDSNEMPPVMDVLVDIILSLLAQSSLPVRAAAEQVFKTFCGDLTRSGMENIFRIIKKGTKSVRHKPVVELDEEGSEEDDDMLGLHDDEGSEEEAGSEDDHDDEVEEVEEIMGDGRLLSLKHTVSCLCYISIFIQLSGIFKIFSLASFLYCCSFVTVASLF
jgi:DNA polymerase phi